MFGENPMYLQTPKERASWVFENCRDAGYSATDKEKPGGILFPFDPSTAKPSRNNLDSIAEQANRFGAALGDGKFILLSLMVRSGEFPDNPLSKNTVRMCFSGSTHLTIARYAAQELIQYLQQGFGNISFFPADLLFLQNHHESGMTWLLDHAYAALTVIDGGRIKVLPGKEVVLYGLSQTFSSAGLVCPEIWGCTGRDDPGLKDTLDAHIQNLEKAAVVLKGFYDDFTFKVEKAPL